SISLRKLSKDLLKAAPRTGVMPLYINLKEWKSSIQPDGGAPTREILYSFIRNFARSLGDVFVAHFFDAYLDQMIDHGRIFFIFDSFDEIPALLDKDETSELIGDISRLIGDLMAGASDARGVLASRPYRQPRRLATEYKHLELRPFSESQIRS